MSPRQRALIGAISGALLVLSAQRATRPELFAAFGTPPPGGLDRLLSHPDPTKPKDLDSAAAYLHAGAERIEEEGSLTLKERVTMVTIAQEGESLEPTNPFWPLAEFVFRHGQGEAAQAAWLRASRGIRYADHQRATLVDDLARLKRLNGDAQAWMYAAVAPRRSAAMIEAIRDTSLRTLHSLRDAEVRIDFAYAMVRNGALIRDGSERLSLGAYGIEMIEGATYPRELSSVVKGSAPYRLWIAKTTFTANLRARHRGAEAANCNRQFRINDGWGIFREINPDGRFRTLAISAALVDTLPGAFLVSALGGGLLWLFGRRVATIAYRTNRFRGAGVTACSLALLVAGTAFGYFLLGLTAGLCALVPALSPDRPRRFDGESLGPLYSLVVGCLTISFSLLTSLAAVSRTLPGAILPDQGTLGAFLGDTGRLAAGAVAILGASALVPPAWAMVRRLPTPAVAAKTFHDLGRAVVWMGLVLAVVSAPISLALDRWIGDSLAEIALNEQIAYNPNDTANR